jgi:hypothetical protein
MAKASRQWLTSSSSFALARSCSFWASGLVAVMAEPSERLWQDKVEHIAKMNGWLVFHPSPHAVRQGVWRTDGQGFPDLVLAHPTRGLIFAELKTEQGKVSPAQKRWGLALSPHAEWYLWRPSQIDLIAKRLGATQ